MMYLMVGNRWANFLDADSLEGGLFINHADSSLRPAAAVLPVDVVEAAGEYATFWQPARALLATRLAAYLAVGTAMVSKAVSVLASCRGLL